MNLDRLIEVLATDKDFSATDETLTATEIANILWLALQIQLVPSPVSEAAIEPPQEVKQQPAVEVVSEPPSQETEPPEPTIEITTAPPTPTPELLPQRALPIWVSDAPLLGDSLGLIRAMRSLLRKVPSGVARRLDEAATVDRIAQTDIWSPILKPEREPWFDVALIVDRSASMNLWQRLADDLESVLKHYGAFRDLRTWDLDVEAGKVKLRSRSGDRSTDINFQRPSNGERPTRSPRELVATDGRCIVIVLSDCVADYWWQGTLWPILQEWAKAMPTVVWQMLPEWMWARTALGMGESVAVRNTVAGAANGQLESEVLSLLPDELSEPSERGMVLPVITSELRDVKAWSRMLAGDRTQVSAGVLMPQHMEIFGDFPEEAENAESEAYTHQIQQFRMMSSPRARQLAALLAAAPVITLPVMRLIRKSMLPQGSPLPVAEVFVSGLLKRSPQQPQNTDSELVQYDFVAGVREALLDMLPAIDAIEVINAVSCEVSKRLGYSSVQQFKAFLLSAEMEQSEELKGLKSFARVTATILRRLGGDYAKLASQFERTETEPPLPETGDFPELEEYRFEMATIFAIVESFEFETAIVRFKVEQRSGLLGLGKKEAVQRLKIQRSRGAAWQFVEDLGNGVELEMVSIPGGSFMMGSPKDEPESYSSEKPQHEVTVPPFYMGKYPITQKQWQAVAALPQIERELDPERSRFKGENLPVERVSWYDAVEFCQRLSQATKREYRLPSEAEWEYACRAGTNTPFHFGETITTELANYDGNGTYNNSPKGEYRQKTTEVGSFPANAFGLSDLHGNVWEWCADDWHNNYEGAPTDGSAWLSEESNKVISSSSDKSDGRKRVLRGGSWIDIPRYCRSAFRNHFDPAIDIDLVIGFRVVCVSPRTL